MQRVPVTSDNVKTAYLCAWVTGRIARGLQLLDTDGMKRKDLIEMQRKA
jgi:hypothetical protein